MDIILFDGSAHQSLWPLTATKPVVKLRVGILTLEEKWNHYLDTTVSIRTKEYLNASFNANLSPASIGIYAGVLPTQNFIKKIKFFNIFYNKIILNFYKIIF